MVQHLKVVFRSPPLPNDLVRQSFFTVESARQTSSYFISWFHPILLMINLWFLDLVYLGLLLWRENFIQSNKIQSNMDFSKLRIPRTHLISPAKSSFFLEKMFALLYKFEIKHGFFKLFAIVQQQNHLVHKKSNKSWELDRILMFALL